MRNLIFCLMGPTASGKTDLAIELTTYFPFEIISVDSAMIYRGMDIGTAKPSPAICAETPHHLLDLIDPTESYSAANFCEDAEAKCLDIFARGKIPLLVGGSMMYFRALQRGLSTLPQSSADIRADLMAEVEHFGLDKLYADLVAIDNVSAAKIHAHDTQRILRALEVYRISGKPLSALIAKGENKKAYEYVNLCIIPEDRSWLHKRIETRFHIMLEQGLIAEVEGLLEKFALDATNPSLRSVGYRQVYDYLCGDYTKEILAEKGIAATRQLAKRQLTWLRSWPDLNLFFAEKPKNLNEMVVLIAQILDN